MLLLLLLLLLLLAAAHVHTREGELLLSGVHSTSPPLRSGRAADAWTSHAYACSCSFMSLVHAPASGSSAARRRRLAAAMLLAAGSAPS
jgi:hypothetical protein